MTRSGQPVTGGQVDQFSLRGIDIKALPQANGGSG
jgi:hypothetical protein